MLRYKRMLISIFIVMMFVTYYVGTDPDTNMFKNLSFGVSLLMTLQIFIIASVSFWLIEVIPDFFVDDIYGKERDLVRKASRTPHGASQALIAKSIRILAYSIITAASIIAFNVQ